MADAGDEVVFSTEAAARPEDETETLRRQVDALSAENRDLVRRSDEINLYLDSLEEENQKNSKKVTEQETELRDCHAEITRLKRQTVNFEAELGGLHKTGDKKQARINQLEYELDKVKEAAKNDHEALEILKPMIQDYVSENLHHIDEMYDTRVISDDAQVEIRALEEDLRAAAAEYDHMDALSTTFHNVAADHARLRARLDIVERHFPDTVVLDEPEFNTFLTEFRQENNVPSPDMNFEDSGEAPDPQGSKSSNSSGNPELSKKRKDQEGSKKPKDEESPENPKDQESPKTPRDQKGSKTPSDQKASQTSSDQRGSKTSSDQNGSKKAKVPKRSEKPTGSKRPDIETRGHHKGKHRSVSLAEELEGVMEDVTEETEETGETTEAVLATPDTAFAPGGFPDSPRDGPVANGNSRHSGAASPDLTVPEPVLSVLASDIDWRLALPAMAFVIMAFVAGSWHGDYRWANANGYAHHSHYYHVNRGLVTFLIDVISGLIIWFLGFFCDPLRVYHSWAQLTYADGTRPG